MATRLTLFIGIVFLVSTTFEIDAEDGPPRGIPRDAEPATMRSVVDGDTIHVTLADGTDDTVRLIGIDTPETKAPGEPVGCFAPEATERMEKLLPPGREVWLEADRTDRDRFDRLLRYVWVEKNDGDRYLANEVMVRDGFALAVRYEPDTERAERLEAAQSRAQVAGRGLWTACPEFATDLSTDVVEEPMDVETTPESVADEPSGGCDPNYAGACVPVFPPDVSCKQIPGKNIRVIGADVHEIDGDFDRTACEA